MAGSEITDKLFTKIVRGLPSGFSLSNISMVFRPADIIPFRPTTSKFKEIGAFYVIEDRGGKFSFLTDLGRV